MDDLTHVLLGLLVTLFFYAKETKLRRPLMWCAAVATLLPDADILLRFFGEGVYLVQHRGFTHSLLGLFILAPFIAYLFSLRYKNFKKFFDVAFICIALHIFLDLATSWGTLIFWPYMKRYTLDWMFIVDPYLLLLMIVGLTSYFWLKREVVIRITLIAVVLHYAFLGYFHAASMDTFNRYAPGEVLASLPTFGEPLVWRIIAQENGTYTISTFDLLYKNVTRVAQVEIPSERIKQEQRSVEELSDFLAFSRFPYVEHQESTYKWHDLMFYGRQFMGVQVTSDDKGFHGKFMSSFD